MRRSTPKNVQEQVLVLSRRRCAICFGLHRDTDIKTGQIAHVDRDAANSGLDNLVFLCLAHHDEYDSVRSQSKGLTPQEVRRFRKELHEAVADWWSQPANFPSLNEPTSVEGHYVRQTSSEQAEILVNQLPDGTLHVTGISLWGPNRPYGPNIGEVEFVAPLTSQSTSFTDPTEQGEYRLDIAFADGRAVARENYVIGYFGMNVSFEGEYLKIGPFAAPPSSDPDGDQRR